MIFAPDLALACILLLTVLALSLSFALNRLSLHSEAMQNLNLEAQSHSLLRKLLSPGIPANWQTNPQRLGLTTDLYRIAILVKETSGVNRLNEAVNVSLIFDPECKLTAHENATRVYEGRREVEFGVYNETLCKPGWLYNATLVWLTNLSAYQSKLFFVYFSAEPVEAPAYSLQYQTSNLSVQAWPAEQLSMLSQSKLAALQQLNYELARQSLGTSCDFYLEANGYAYGAKARGEVVARNVPAWLQHANGSLSLINFKLAVWH